jgi:hypothetical protein
LRRLLVITQAHIAVENNHPPRPRREGVGVYVGDLAEGAVLELVTERHIYKLLKHSGSEVLMLGHPIFCPQPVVVKIIGSFDDMNDASPETGLIGCGMYLMFEHPVFENVAASRILEIRVR